MHMRLLALAFACGLSLQAAEPVKTKINLFDVIKSGDVEYHINDQMDFKDDPKDIWKFDGDTLHVSGRGYGYVATKQDYRDYHLVIEFKWGDKTWGKREKASRDNGLLLHSYGPHGAYGNTWMASIEAQIIEGGVGDILVLSPKLADGKELTTSVSAEYTLDRDKEKIFTKGAPRQTVTKGRINWAKRDVDWTDTKGFRGREDVESPPGEWNRLEVIAKGDTLQYFVNGALVNEAYDCKPSQGKILLQTEGAEMFVRRYELWPLGEFKEKWNPIQASGGSDVPVLEGQQRALSAEESQKLIQLDGPYEAQLVASEPLVLDPVEVTWDSKGRMYVADMRDYPLGPPKAGDPWLSRIVLLTDEDGDGRMDKSVVFADHMDNVQGLLPYNGGLIATTRTQVLFLKDTNDDGKADVTESLIKGFNPRHAQLQVSAPRWGLDGCVYFNNGLDAKEIYPTADPKAAINVPRCNFRWDPRTGKIEPTSGNGQYGGSFDDYGHHFFCSNRNPVMFAVMPYEAVIRNPAAGITQGYEDIAPAGAETRVYPLKITHTTADAHAGTNTACSGLGVYRGDLMPELKNNVFVPDPTGQLITRYKVEPKGASLKATRVGAKTEFFRSGDEWSRPVNFTTGPDGAIYVCDMYRRYIDHARFFPEEFVKTHDMREGENQGRIWRIVPKGTKARKVEPAPEKIADLVAWLGHENAWQRETAQRLLSNLPHAALELFAKEAAAAKGSVLADVHLLGVCHALMQQHDEEECRKLLEAASNPVFLRSFEDPVLLETTLGSFADYAQVWDGTQEFKGSKAKLDRLAFLVLCKFVSGGASRTGVIERLLGRFPDDSWIHNAVLAAATTSDGARTTGVILDWFLKQTAAEKMSDAKAEFVRKLARISASEVGASQFADYDFTHVMDCLKLSPGKLVWWKPALLQGVSEGLPRSNGKLAKTLAAFISKPSAQYEDAAKEIGVLMSHVESTATDVQAPLDTRLAVLPLLAQNKWDKTGPVVKGLLTTSQPPELTTAALALLKKYVLKDTSPLIYELIPKAGPSLKGPLVGMLTGNPAAALELFKKMEKGELPTALVDIETRWRWQRGTGELRDLAVKLFGQPSGDRAAVITSYMDCSKKLGNAEKGKAVFATVCIACHKVGDLGMEVGPPLSDVKVKLPEALLSDILDPNRMFEARWSAYQIDTKDNRILSGLITGETSDSVQLTMMGGIKETVQRSNIKEMKSLDRSLMPVGLEAGISKEQMSDLLAFLLGR